VLDPVYALNDAVVSNDPVGKLYKPAPSPIKLPVNADALTVVMSRFPWIFSALMFLLAIGISVNFFIYKYPY
jgi:hypothetical protein